jgi:hypothetical protein
MNPRRLGGMVLIVVGIGIAYTGYQLSNSLGNQLHSAFQGSPTDSVTLRYVLGAASVGVGAILAR